MNMGSSGCKWPGCQHFVYMHLLVHASTIDLSSVVYNWEECMHLHTIASCFTAYFPRWRNVRNVRQGRVTLLSNSQGQVTCCQALWTNSVCDRSFPQTEPNCIWNDRGISRRTPAGCTSLQLRALAAYAQKRSRRDYCLKPRNGSQHSLIKRPDPVIHQLTSRTGGRQPF